MPPGPISCRAYTGVHVPHPGDEIRSRFDLIFGYLIDFEIRSQTLREQAPMPDGSIPDSRRSPPLRAPLVSLTGSSSYARSLPKSSIGKSTSTEEESHDNQPTTLMAVERAWSDFLNRWAPR